MYLQVGSNHWCPKTHLVLTNRSKRDHYCTLHCITGAIDKAEPVRRFLGMIEKSMVVGNCVSFTCILYTISIFPY